MKDALVNIMEKKIKYSTKFFGPKKGRSTDLGIDIPSHGVRTILPGEVKVIDTGVACEFPLFTKLQRFFWRLVFGIDVTGVGTLVWPRGRSDHAVLAGVIDAEYRGEIKVKVFNPLDRPIAFNAGDLIAQMVPVLVLNIPLVEVQAVSTDTDRGVSGGINK